MTTFREFVDKKTRAAKKQLDTLYKIFQKEGITTSNHLEDEEPYIFLKSPAGKLSFDGIRVYKIGNNIAFRVQKEDKTHPYGKAYSLDVEDMFNDLLSDKMDEEKAGKEVMKAIVEEIRNFFNKSAEAEQELRDGDFDKKGDPLGKVMMRSTGTDYANKVSGVTPGTKL